MLAIVLAFAFLAEAAPTGEIKARLVDLELERTTHGHYNRITIEISTPAADPGNPYRLNVCPDHARVETFRRYGDRWQRQDRFVAHAIADESGSPEAACRLLEVDQKGPARLIFYIRNVPGRWDAADLYILRLDIAGSSFLFPSR